MGVWARIAVYIDAAERLRGWARWLAGACIWGVFALVMLAFWLAPGWIAARLFGW
jgi:hypothetical protein